MNIAQALSQAVGAGLLWLIEDPWFAIVENDVGVYKMTELDSLHAIGQITDSTKVVP